VVSIRYFCILTVGVVVVGGCSLNIPTTRFSAEVLMNATRFAGRLTILCLFSLAVMAMWTACGDDDAAAPGGGGGGGGGTPSASFIDCWVGGLEYTTSSTPPVEGLTGNGGIFSSPLGETVTFKVGDIVLGSGVSGPCMNPIEITNSTDIFEYRPTNIARFIQTIDDDDDLTTGINIIEAVRTAAAGKSLNFNQHPDAFAADSDVQQVVSDLTSVTAADTRTLVATDAARAHLRTSILKALQADYGGTFDGYRGQDEWTGEWGFTIDVTGNIVGTFRPITDATLSLSGNVQPSGSFFCDDGGATGLMFTGRIVRDTDGLQRVEGSWNDYQQGSGTIEGNRVTVYTSTIECD